MRLLPRRSRGAAAVVLSVLVTGCAGVGDAGVAIRPLSVDVVFGVPPEISVAAPPNVPTLDLPQQPTGDFTFRPTPATVPPVPPRAVDPCPVAPVTSAARLEAPLAVTTERPRIGDYRWRRSVSVSEGDESAARPPVTGFEQRQILSWEEREQVNPANREPAFGYSTLQPSVDDPMVLVKIDWNYDDSPAQRVNPPAAAQGQSEELRPQRVGNDGLAIERITRYAVQEDGSLEPIGLPFQPSRPVTYLTHPVTMQDTMRSVGTDPVTLATMVVTHKPVDKIQVDACGEKVDAIVVEATMTFTQGPDTTTSELRYGVATQYGAVIVFEEATTTTPAATITSSFSLAQADPSPLLADPTEGEDLTDTDPAGGS